MIVTATKASEEQLQARLGLRRSNATGRHRSPVIEAKHPGKGNRKNWKKDLR